MDKPIKILTNDTPHRVEVTPGSLNAKTRRNVVTSGAVEGERKQVLQTQAEKDEQIKLKAEADAAANWFAKPAASDAQNAQPPTLLSTPPTDNRQTLPQHLQAGGAGSAVSDSNQSAAARQTLGEGAVASPRQALQAHEQLGDNLQSLDQPTAKANQPTVQLDPHTDNLQALAADTSLTSTPAALPESANTSAPQLPTDPAAPANLQALAPGEANTAHLESMGLASPQANRQQLAPATDGPNLVQLGVDALANNQQAIPPVLVQQDKLQDLPRGNLTDNQATLNEGLAAANIQIAADDRAELGEWAIPPSQEVAADDASGQPQTMPVNQALASSQKNTDRAVVVALTPEQQAQLLLRKQQVAESFRGRVAQLKSMAKNVNSSLDQLEDDLDQKT